MNYTPKIILLLAGKAGSGKNTFANAMPQYRQFAFADPLKTAAQAISGQPLEDFHLQNRKNTPLRHIPAHTPRTLLQWLGTDICRKHLCDDLWARLLIERIHAESEGIPDFQAVVTDCRFENEYTAVRNAFPYDLVAMVRIKSPWAGIAPDHASEQWTPEFEKIFCTVHNTGTLDELKRHAEFVHDQLLAARDILTNDIGTPRQIA